MKLKIHIIKTFSLDENIYSIMKTIKQYKLKKSIFIKKMFKKHVLTNFFIKNIIKK